MIYRLFRPVKDFINETTHQVTMNPGKATIAALMMNMTLAAAKSIKNVTTTAPTPANSSVDVQMTAGITIGGILMVIGCYCFYKACKSNNPETEPLMDTENQGRPSLLTPVRNKKYWI